ncbi:predicted protein [Enterococcus gallinarum EG2]|nr:predicted protein [Enterococcus gallinarum EG2]
MLIFSSSWRTYYRKMCCFFSRYLGGSCIYFDALFSMGLDKECLNQLEFYSPSRKEDQHDSTRSRRYPKSHSNF